MLSDRRAPADAGLPLELHQLLDEIAAEPAPERLLELALELQAALQARRAAPAPAGEASAPAM
jgi:hypothetical protein